MNRLQELATHAGTEHLASFRPKTPFEQRAQAAGIPLYPDEENSPLLQRAMQAGIHLYPDIPPEAPSGWRSPLAQVGLPLAGAWGAGKLLDVLAPQIGLPLEGLGALATGAAASSLGGMAGRAAQQGLAGEPLNPADLGRTGAEFAAFGPLMEGAGSALGQVGKGVRWAVPFIQNLGKEGTILNSGLRAGIAAGAMGSGEAALEPGTPAERLQRAQAAFLPNATSGFGVGAALQTVPNFARAVSGNRALKATLQHQVDQAMGQEEETVRTARQQAESTKVSQQRQIALDQERLSGQPNILTQQMAKESHRQVVALRNGPVATQFRMRSRQAAVQAWSLMKHVIQMIDSSVGPLTVGDLDQAALNRFEHDPERLANVRTVIRNIFGPLEGEIKPIRSDMTASDIEAASSRLGQQISRPAMRGQAALLASDLPLVDARSVFADVLEQKAPPSMKGNVRQAKANWKEYATDRDLFHSYFHPSASVRAPTDKGARLFQDFVRGKASPSERGIVRRLQTYTGVNQTARLQLMADRQGAIAERQAAFADQATRAQENLKALRQRVSEELTARRYQVMERFAPEKARLANQTRQAQSVGRLLGPVGIGAYLVRRSLYNALMRNRR